MRKPLASFKKGLIVGVVAVILLLFFYILNYESLMHSIVAWIDQLKSGQ